jgi:hypothetical protein
MQLLESLSPSSLNMMGSGGDESMEDRRKLAYVWYRRLDFPSKDVMKCSISNTKECDITEDDVDLLPWNRNETKVFNVPEDNFPITTDLYGTSDSSTASEATPTSAASTLPPSEILTLPLGSLKDQDRGRKNAYKWYKLLGKPTRETMCRIVEYTKGPDYTRQDLDLLPWNFEETEVVEEVKRRKRPEPLEKGSYDGNNTVCEVHVADILDNDSKNLNVRMEDEFDDNLTSPHISSPPHMDESFHTCVEDPARDESEEVKLDTVFEVAVANKVDNDSKDVKVRLEDELDDNLKNLQSTPSSHHLNENSHNCDEDSEDIDRPEVLQMNRAEEEHKRKREARLRKREAAAAAAAAEKDTSGEDAEETCAGDDNREATKRKTTAGVDNSEGARRARVFSLYSQMCQPIRTAFKRRVAALEYMSMDITSDDIDLLPWNATGSMVNISKMNALARASIMKRN